MSFDELKFWWNVVWWAKVRQTGVWQTGVRRIAVVPNICNQTFATFSMIGTRSSEFLPAYILVYGKNVLGIISQNYLVTLDAFYICRHMQSSPIVHNNVNCPRCFLQKEFLVIYLITASTFTILATSHTFSISLFEGATCDSLIRCLCRNHYSLPGPSQQTC
jgi:hypothetical protein